MSAGGTTTFHSILEKPLNQLTEDDISQLTREDCRKYLKDKGMRRPSWNKSQAIQQVICLKALLEPCDDSGAGALRKIVASPPSNIPRMTSNSADSAKEASADVLISASPEESVGHRVKEQPKSTVEERPKDGDNNAISPSSKQKYLEHGCSSHCGRDASVGQMTIFYCGKVNVYDGVPPDKARAIMQLASNPIHFTDSTSAVGSFPQHVQNASAKGVIASPNASISQPIHTEKITEYTQHCWKKGKGTRDPDADGQASRKVSLQRYLEKRKDRGRLKVRKQTGGSSSSLEVYMNHQMNTHTSNCNSSRSDTNSPPDPGLPQTFSCMADNKPRVAGLPVYLNEKNVLEY